MAYSDKLCSAQEAVSRIKPGDTVMVGGFSDPGSPKLLIEALVESGQRELTFISCGFGLPGEGLGKLLRNGQVKRIIGTYFNLNPEVVEAVDSGRIEVRLLPMGSLAESIRAGGMGIPAYYTPTSAGTELARGKETRVFDGRECVLEYALRADVALIQAERADSLGNLACRKTSRNFNPLMAAAAAHVIAQVNDVVETGALDPDSIDIPHIFVDRLVLAKS